MKLTFFDIAKRCDLLLTPFPKARNGYGNVAKNVLILVSQFAHGIGYIPHCAVRQLRRQLNDDFGTKIPMENPGLVVSFLGGLISELFDATSANDGNILVSTVVPTSPSGKALFQYWVPCRKVAGLVETLTDSMISVLITLRSIYSFCETLALKYHLITHDYWWIAYIGKIGDRKIEPNPSIGFIVDLMNSSMASDPHLVSYSKPAVNGGFHAIIQLLEPATSSLVFLWLKNLVVIGAMHTLHQLGIKAGCDGSSTGFEGIANPVQTQLSITTEDQPVYIITWQLLTELLFLINGGQYQKPHVRICQPLSMLAFANG